MTFGTFSCLAVTLIVTVLPASAGVPPSGDWFTTVLGAYPAELVVSTFTLNPASVSLAIAAPLVMSTTLGTFTFLVGGPAGLDDGDWGALRLGLP